MTTPRKDQLVDLADLQSTAAGLGSALVGHEGGTTVKAAIAAVPTTAALAAVGGSALVGHDAEATVNAALDACTRAATLAAAGGAALVGSAVGGNTVEQRLVATEAVANAANGFVKRTVTVGHADLTEAVAGNPQVINIGAACPANARVALVSVYGTELTGGGTVSVALDVGTAGDPNAIVAAADVLTAFVDGESSTLPAGIAPNKKVGAAQLIATFTPDGAHALADLAAGSITIDVMVTAIA